MGDPLQQKEWSLPAGSVVKIGGLPYELANETVVLGFQEPEFLDIGKLDFNTTDFESVADNLLASEFPHGIRDRLVELLDDPASIFRLNARATPGAGITLDLKPSQGLLEIVAALRAGKVDRAIAD